MPPTQEFLARDQVPSGQLLTPAQRDYLVGYFQRRQPGEIKGFLTDALGQSATLPQARKLVRRFPELADRLCPLLRLAYSEGILFQDEALVAFFQNVFYTLGWTPDQFDRTLREAPQTIAVRLSEVEYPNE